MKASRKYLILIWFNGKNYPEILILIQRYDFTIIAAKRCICSRSTYCIYISTQYRGYEKTHSGGCSAGNSVKHNNVKLQPFHKLIKIGCSGQQLNVIIYQLYMESYCYSHCVISRDKISTSSFQYWRINAL